MTINQKSVLKNLDFQPIGTLSPSHSEDIPASPLGIGFECLDRRMFDPEQTYDRVGELGVKWARVQTGWARCEQQKGEYDFGWLDDIVDSLLERGVQPWFNLGYGNQLYIPEAQTPDAVGYTPVFREEARRGWQRYVDALACHFADRVTHWEIWNEANAGGNFWEPKDSNAEDYSDLVRLSARPIRHHLNDAFLIGGVVCTGLRPGTMRFIEEMLETGVGQRLDAISYHPYYWNPDEGDAPLFDGLKALAHQYNPELEFWQGESGGNSRTGQRGAMSEGPWDQAIHAKWVLRRTLVDLRNGVDHSSYFHICDFENYVLGGPEGKSARHGLLTGPEYEPTEAYFAYQCLCTLFDSRTRRDHRVVMYPGPGRSNPMAEWCDDDARDRMKNMSVRWAGFRRDGHPVWAWWLPTDLFDPPETPVSINASFWHPADTTLDHPVIIDPYAQTVYDTSLQCQDANTWTTEDLPLAEYPLIMTEE